MDIVPRSEWGARPPRNRVPTVWRAGVTLWLHHTVGQFVAPNIPVPGPKWSRTAKGRVKIKTALANRTRVQALERSAMREIQAFHQNTRGWADIGYAYVCFASGRIYEGRGKNVVAAHCPGKNHEPSVALAGDYSRRTPTDRQRIAVAQLKGWLSAGAIRGHRQAPYPTTCPGDAAVRAFGL